MQIALCTANMSRLKVIFAIGVLTAILQLTEAGTKCRGDGESSGNGCDRSRTGNRPSNRYSGGFDESSRHGSSSSGSDDDASSRNIERNPGSERSDDEGFISDYLPDRSSSVERQQLLNNFMEAKNRHMNRMRDFERTDDRPRNPGPGPGHLDIDIQKLHKAMQPPSISGNQIEAGARPEPLSADVSQDLPEHSTTTPSPIIDEILKDKTFNVYNQFLEMDKTDPKTTVSSKKDTDSDQPFVSLLTPSTPAEAMYLYSAMPEFSSKYPKFQNNHNQHQQDDLFLGLYGGLDLSSSAHSGIPRNYYALGTGTAYDPGLPAFGSNYPVYGAGTGGGGFTLHG